MQDVVYFSSDDDSDSSDENLCESHERLHNGRVVVSYFKLPIG